MALKVFMARKIRVFKLCQKKLFRKIESIDNQIFIFRKQLFLFLLIIIRHVIPDNNLVVRPVEQNFVTLCFYTWLSSDTNPKMRERC